MESLLDILLTPDDAGSDLEHTILAGTAMGNKSNAMEPPRVTSIKALKKLTGGMLGRYGLSSVSHHRQVKAEEKEWPSPAERKTNSRTAHNLLADLRFLDLQLHVAQEWISQYRHNQGHWHRLRDELYDRIQRTARQTQSDRMPSILRMFDLCPNFPAWPVSDYIAARPPLMEMED